MVNIDHVRVYKDRREHPHLIKEAHADETEDDTATETGSNFMQRKRRNRVSIVNNSYHSGNRSVGNISQEVGSMNRSIIKKGQCNKCLDSSVQIPMLCNQSINYLSISLQYNCRDLVWRGS